MQGSNITDIRRTLRRQHPYPVIPKRKMPSANSASIADNALERNRIERPQPAQAIIAARYEKTSRELSRRSDIAANLSLAEMTFTLYPEYALEYLTSMTYWFWFA